MSNFGNPTMLFNICGLESGKIVEGLGNYVWVKVNQWVILFFDT